MRTWKWGLFLKIQKSYGFSTLTLILIDDCKQDLLKMQIDVKLDVVTEELKKTKSEMCDEMQNLKVSVRK